MVTGSEAIELADDYKRPPEAIGYHQLDEGYDMNIDTGNKEDLIDVKTKQAELIMEQMGTSGKYQYYILVFFSIISFGTGFMVYLIAYVITSPLSECPDLTYSTGYRFCSEQEACDLISQGKPARVYFTTDGWSKQYNMACDSADVRESTVMLLLCVKAVLAMPILVLIDIYGRKFGMLLSYAYVLIGIIISQSIDSFVWKAIGLGILNCTEISYSCLAAVIVTECTSKRTKFRSTIISLVFLAYGLGTIAINFFAYISTQADFLLLLTFGSVGILGFPALFLWESPMYLLEKGDVDGFERVVAQIGKYNNRQLTADADHGKRMVRLRHLVQQCNERQQELEKTNSLYRYPILAILFTKTYLWSLLVLSVIGTNFTWVYYGISVNIEDLGLKDIQINGIIFGITQAFGYLILVPYASGMDRRKWCIIFQIILLIGAGILLATSILFDTNSTKVQLSQTIVSCFLCGLPLSCAYTLFYMLVSELFPAELRGTANSLVMLASNLFGILAPTVGKKFEQFDIHNLVGCSIVGIVALPLTFTLRKTRFK